MTSLSLACLNQTNGTYQISHIDIDPLAEYRIRIITPDGKVYVSDFTALRQTPPIDSVTWSVDFDNDGVQVFVTTHDPDMNTKYYQWEYEETWEYQTAGSFFDYVKDPSNPTPTYAQAVDNIITIFEDPFPRRCWRTEKSNRIYTASSTRLAQDVIYNFPLAFVPNKTEKIANVFSILVSNMPFLRKNLNTSRTWSSCTNFPVASSTPNRLP